MKTSFYLNEYNLFHCQIEDFSGKSYTNGINISDENYKVKIKNLSFTVSKVDLFSAIHSICKFQKSFESISIKFELDSFNFMESSEEKFHIFSNKLCITRYKNEITLYLLFVVVDMFSGNVSELVIPLNSIIPYDPLEMLEVFKTESFFIDLGVLNNQEVTMWN